MAKALREWKHPPGPAAGLEGRDPAHGPLQATMISTEDPPAFGATNKATAEVACSAPRPTTQENPEESPGGRDTVHTKPLCLSLDNRYPGFCLNTEGLG